LKIGFKNFKSDVWESRVRGVWGQNWPAFWIFVRFFYL